MVILLLSPNSKSDNYLYRNSWKSDNIGKEAIKYSIQSISHSILTAGFVFIFTGIFCYEMKSVKIILVEPKCKIIQVI